MALMRLGPVLGNGGGAIGQMAACMAGYAHTAMEDLDSRGRGAYLYLLLGELIRHAVPVMIKGYVIIDIDAMGLPMSAAAKKGTSLAVERKPCVGLRSGLRGAQK